MKKSICPRLSTADFFLTPTLRFIRETEGKEGEGGGREAQGERSDRGKAEKDGETEGVMSGAERKQAVLNVAFRYLDTYRELLQEEGERSNSFPKVTHTHTYSQLCCCLCVCSD